VAALPFESRASALAAACPDDPALVVAVQLLLDQPESAAGFLSRPALGAGMHAPICDERDIEFPIFKLCGY